MPALPSEGQIIPRSTLRHRPISDMKLTELPRVPRASLTQTRQPEANTTTPVIVPVRKSMKGSRWQRLPLVAIGVGMIGAILLVFVGQLLIGWIGMGLDELHYGYPRTFQMDEVVGQDDTPAHPSHFITLNLAGQVEVIEFPGGDAAHAKIYLGAHLDGRHNGHPDMIMQFQGEKIIFRNAQGSFHAPPGISS